VGRSSVRAGELDVWRRSVTCDASQDDATVKCWGKNGDGQLGLGDILARGDGSNGLLLLPLSPQALRIATVVGQHDPPLRVAVEGRDGGWWLTVLP
jgi:hypothetical protein